MIVASPTDEALAAQITRGLCPDCRHRGFVIGPQGGKSTNIECANVDCRSRFTAAFYSGEAVLVTRIPRDIEWPSEPHTVEDHGFTGGTRAAVKMIEDAARQYRRAKFWFAVAAVLLLTNFIAFAVRLFV